MKLLGRAGIGLLLIAACDREVYVGRDAPLALRESRDAEAATPPIEPPASQEPAAEPSASPDAGTLTQTAVAPPAQMAPVAPPAPPPCAAGRGDCDADPSNGCEADLTKDRQHCGTCGARCETVDCSCDNAKLTLHCAAGHADCDGMVNNGCEADLMTSMQHCGACQRLCHANGHDVTSAMCVSGRCDVTCEPRISPEEDCDGNPDNGCETYLLFDTKNCGACGDTCNLRCEAGVCML